MGIKIQELLLLDYFQNFVVLAGHKHLDCDIQGVTVMDAPDCYKWNKGKELVISNGYAFRQDMECYKPFLSMEKERRISGFMIKVGRYLEPIPAEMIADFEKSHIPLIQMPFSVPYMEVMNQVNVAVMNKSMKRFLMQSREGQQESEQPYKERKIKRILKGVEKEMEFPALLYDVIEAKSYKSSPGFQKECERYRLKEQDFWEPSMNCSRHTLCDQLHMVRYRMLEEPDCGELELPQTRFSWITIPILVKKKVQAYFVVMESRELLDYYDEYSIRIATLLLQSVYEQIVVARNAGNIGFENLIHFALNHGVNNPQQLMIQASSLNLNLKTTYYFILLHQINAEISIADYREEISQCIQCSFPSGTASFAFTDLNECIILLNDDKSDKVIKKYLDKFHGNILERIKKGQFLYGACYEKESLTQTARAVDRCRRAINLGVLLYPGEHVFDYCRLGPLAWLQVPPDELDMMFREYLPVLQDRKNEELLRTLRVYLENNMNYSATAEKMYVHINTIRKRVDRIEVLFHIDWQDHMAKVKLELMLRMFHY